MFQRPASYARLIEMSMNFSARGIDRHTDADILGSVEGIVALQKRLESGGGRGSLSRYAATPSLVSPSKLGTLLAHKTGGSKLEPPFCYCLY
jgi:hypothetical protein